MPVGVPRGERRSGGGNRVEGRVEIKSDFVSHEGAKARRHEVEGAKVGLRFGRWFDFDE
jgi:hypothetical protein